MKCTTSWDDFTNLKVHCTGERYGSSSTKRYSSQIEWSSVRTGLRERCIDLPLQIPGDTLSDGMSELGEFITGRRLDPAKPRRGSIDSAVDSIQKNHR